MDNNQVGGGNTIVIVSNSNKKQISTIKKIARKVDIDDRSADPILRSGKNFKTQKRIVQSSESSDDEFSDTSNE
jgi:hypothetical protein